VTLGQPNTVLRARVGLLLALALAVCLCSGPSQAHSLGAGYFAYRFEVRVEPETIRIVYSVEVPLSVLQQEFVRAMLDAPPGTDSEQIRAEMRRNKADVLLAGLEVVLNGAQLRVQEDPAQKRESRPNDEVFLLYRLNLRVDVKDRLGDHNRLIVRNRNYLGQQAVYSHAVELSEPFGSLRTGLEKNEGRFEIDPRTQIQWFFSGRHRDLDLTFDRGGDRGTAQEGQVRTNGSGGAAPADSAGQRIERFLRTPGWSVRWILGALAVALLLGAFHALSPGHGKTVVASYLVGTRGRVRDAVLLGLTVTLTHTSSVFVLGLVTLFLSQTVLPETLVPYLTLLSGLLIVGVGGQMLVSRVQRLRGRRAAALPGARGADRARFAVSGPRASRDPCTSHEHEHEHADEHGHGHEHGHLASGEKVTLRALVSLGVSGGLVPCPSALVVLLSSIAYRRVALGLAMVLAFSVGLAMVLVGIGVALVLARQAFRRMRPPGKWMEWLPVASALVIVALGVAMCVRAMTGGLGAVAS
jgi:ABC-type nickel/cobalt efflux system permease component RcnA